MAARPLAGAEWYIVRLSDVREDIRVRVADEIIAAEDMERVHPEQAILLRMAALAPMQNPKLRVRRTKLRYGGVKP
jgi:hypothetical protein